MVMPHRSKTYRGHPPDYFSMLSEDEPARVLGRIGHWTWSDEPNWNVEVCRACNWDTGKQCDHCAEIRALKRRGDFITKTQRRRERRMAMKEPEWMDTPREAS